MEQACPQDAVLTACLCVSLPEEDKREAGARPFPVRPRSGAEQKPIGKSRRGPRAFAVLSFLPRVKAAQRVRLWTVRIPSAT